PSYRASYCASTTPRHPRPRLSPYTTLSRSIAGANRALGLRHGSCTAPRPAVGGRATDRGASADVVRASDDVHELGACARIGAERSEEHTSELQSREKLVCRLLLEKKEHRRR